MNLSDAAQRYIPVNVSKKEVIDVLMEDPDCPLSENIMTVLEQILERTVTELAYFEVDYELNQTPMSAFCEVFDEAYQDIEVIKLWYFSLPSE